MRDARRFVSALRAAARSKPVILFNSSERGAPAADATADAVFDAAVRRAAPFPVPARMGKVTYTETWLWDKSGRFQLDTLTEGQRSEL